MDIDDLKLAFGNLIFIKRQQLGLYQSDVAAEIGCKQPTIARYELGKQLPDEETAGNIFAFLNLPYGGISDLERSISGEANERPARRVKPLTPDLVEISLSLLDKGWYQHEVAEFFGINQASMSKIARKNGRGRPDLYELGFADRDEYERAIRSDCAGRPVYQLFGALVTDALSRTDRTQRDIAADLGVDKSLITLYKQGKRLPAPEAAPDVFKVLNIPLESLEELVDLSRAA